jgi:putative spermidine/putrescine transport system permease protein
VQIEAGIARRRHRDRGGRRDGAERHQLARAQLDVAQSLGASPAQAFRQVMLPQLAAPIAGSLCLVAAVVFGAYGTALALVGTRLEILPLQLYSLISETGSDFPAAAALALLITAACSAIMTAGAWFGSRHEKHL